MKKRGFTLIEILIALFIFAILGVLSGIGLHQVLLTRAHVSRINRHAQQIELAMTMLDRDITQMINRPVLDTHGTQLDALVISSANSIEFTRAGVANPLGYFQRGDLKRVRYSIVHDALIRTTWPVLDRSINTKPQRMMLLKHVGGLSVQFVNAKGQRGYTWSNQNNRAFPAAIILTFHFGKLGKLERIIPIPAEGNHAT